MDVEAWVRIVLNNGVLFALAIWVFRKDGPVAALNAILTAMQTSLTKVDAKLESGIQMAREGRDRQQQTIEAVSEEVREVRDKFTRIEGKLRIGSDPNLPKTSGR